jgi:hypothetical protein
MCTISLQTLEFHMCALGWVPVDPTNDLSKLVTEHKYEEALWPYKDVMHPLYIGYVHR